MARLDLAPLMRFIDSPEYICPVIHAPAIRKPNPIQETPFYAQAIVFLSLLLFGFMMAGTGNAATRMPQTVSFESLIQPKRLLILHSYCYGAGLVQLL